MLLVLFFDKIENAKSSLLSNCHGVAHSHTDTSTHLAVLELVFGHLRNAGAHLVTDDTGQ